MNLSLPLSNASVRAESAAPTLFRRLAAGLWTALEASGRCRAAHELSLLAEHWEHSQPELAASLRRTVRRGL